MTTKDDVRKIWLTETAIWVELNNGRQGCEQFSDYAPLAVANKQARSEYEVSYLGIHWPKLDEDLSFDGFFVKI